MNFPFSVSDQPIQFRRFPIIPFLPARTYKLMQCFMLKIHLLVPMKTNWTIHICILAIEKLPIVQYFNKFQSMYAMCYLSRISSNYLVKPFSWVKGNFDLSIIKGFYSNMTIFAQLKEKSSLIPSVFTIFIQKLLEL